jgi:hypothetical protein
MTTVLVARALPPFEAALTPFYIPYPSLKLLRCELAVEVVRLVLEAIELRIVLLDQPKLFCQHLLRCLMVTDDLEA